MSEPFDLAKHRAEQERARALGLGYAVLRHIILQAHSDADDGISVGQAVELVREMGLRAVDRAVAEERDAAVTWIETRAFEFNQRDGKVETVLLGLSREIDEGDHRKEKP